MNCQNKKYVLVYDERHFFKEQNLYLGKAILTEKLEEAAIYTLDEAEAKFNCMNNPELWKIWSIKTGIVLDSKSERHIRRKRREELLAELKELEKTEGSLDV